MLAGNSLCQFDKLRPLGPKLFLDLGLELIEFALSLADLDGQLVLKGLAKGSGDIIYARFLGEGLEEGCSTASMNTILCLFPVSEPPTTLRTSSVWMPETLEQDGLTTRAGRAPPKMMPYAARTQMLSLIHEGSAMPVFTSWRPSG